MNHWDRMKSERVQEVKKYLELSPEEATCADLVVALTLKVKDIDDRTKFLEKYADKTIQSMGEVISLLRMIVGGKRKL